MDLAACRGRPDPRPFGGAATGPHAPDRGTCGTKRRGRTEGQGRPLAVVVAGATRHDRKRRAATLEALVGERPAPTVAAPPPGWLAKGDADDECRQVAEPPASIPHLRARGEEEREKQEIPGDRARRWGVEGCHAWLHRFRTRLVRVEKKLETPLALRQLACADMVRKRAEVFR